MKKLPILKPGDSVDIIAPASRCSDQHLEEIKSLLLSWKLKVHVDDHLFGNDLLCANHDEARLGSLKHALQNLESKAIICARGGYGSMRLIPHLLRLSPHTEPKIFVGMSDVTALNLFLQQQWHWPTLHAALASDKFSADSIDKVRSFLFAELKQIEFDGTPLNTIASHEVVIQGLLTGGNLSLLQTSIGTAWQMDTQDKIIFIEEVNERGYRVDRMLEHLSQAGIFQNAKAIVLGDFIGGDEPGGKNFVHAVLKRFAQSSMLPIVSIKGVGHGYVNFPLPLGTNVNLQLGHASKLICFR